MYWKCPSCVANGDSIDCVREESGDVWSERNEIASLVEIIEVFKKIGTT